MKKLFLVLLAVAILGSCNTKNKEVKEEVNVEEVEETEDLAIRKLPLQEAVQMVIDGAITDAISAAALLRLHATRTSSSL